MNPVFFRGSPSQNNFYTYSYHDYFSYEGRRIGAHSGTSSDDLVSFSAGELDTAFTIYFMIARHKVWFREARLPQLPSTWNHRSKNKT